MIVLVASNRQCVLRAAMGRTVRLPRIVANSARIVPAFLQCNHDIGNTVAHHGMPPPQQSPGQEKKLVIADMIGGFRCFLDSNG